MSKPSSPSFRHESSTHLCSYNDRQNLKTPNTVKMTHCLCCDDMSLLFFVESSHAFDRHVVCLRCSRCKDNIFCVSPNQVCDMLANGPVSKT